MEPRIQYAKTEDGVSIAYSTLGEGLPLALVPHPAFSHIQSEWQLPGASTWYERLAEERMVVRYDGRGTGLSDRSVTDFSLDTSMLDLEAVVDCLGPQRFTLLGNLDGVPTAIAYAASHPERVSHLVLWCSQVGASDLRGTPEAEVELALMDKDWVIYTETVARMAFGWSAGEDVQRFAAFLREAVTQETYRAISDLLWEWDVTALLPQVRAQTLVLCRRETIYGIEPSRILAAGIPDARLIVLEGQAPLAYYGGSESVLQAIDEFLDEGEEDEPATPVAPSGLVTILFADIANSTALTERMGDAAFRDNARDLDTALRKAIASTGGTAVDGKLLGDGVLAVFGAAREAIACSSACHAAAEENGLELHVGIHAGDVIREEGNVFGGAVNIAARVADASGAGETLVSQTVRDLARTSAGVAFEDRGEHELKGIDEPQRLWSVRWREDG